MSILLAVLCIISSLTTLSSSANTNKDIERKIVIFSREITENKKSELLHKHKGTKLKDLDLINGMVVELPKNSKIKEEVDILYVEDDGIVSVNAKKTPNTPPPVQPTEVIPWGIEYMNAPSMWSNETDNIKVGVLDTGIDLDHPDLKENIKGSYNAISKKKSGNDDNGHGTHVAGIIAACKNEIGVVGMIPNADLYAIKVLDSNGNGYISDIIEGLDWAIRNDMDILNMSFGTTTNSQSLHDTITKASQAGIIMVAAAGNNYGGSCEYPAAYDEVIGVCAIDKNGSIADFSAVSGVDVGAPGVEIYSTTIGGGYVEMDGTSMATPHLVMNLVHN